jgi:accessory gene regulator protein AgrB
MQQVFVQYVEMEYFRINSLLLKKNDNISVTEVKYCLTEIVLNLFSICMIYSLFITGDKS